MTYSDTLQRYALQSADVALRGKCICPLIFGSARID